MSSLTSSPPSVLVERRVVAGRPLRFAAEMADILDHRSLLYELVHRDLTVRYKRSVLGFFWTMLHPLLLMLIFVAIFATVFRSGAPHYETYFLSAYIAWNFFAQTLINSMASTAWNGPLMKRVRVPPSIFTLSSVISGLVNLLLSMAMLLVVMLIAGAPLRLSLLFLPVSILIAGLFTLGVSLAFTAVAIYFGDVREMAQAGLPALMYLTPIIYPLSVVPDRIRPLIAFNPLLYIVELIRVPMYGGSVPPLRLLGIGAALSGAALILGWEIFRRLAPRFHAQL